MRHSYLGLFFPINQWLSYRLPITIKVWIRFSNVLIGPRDAWHYQHVQLQRIWTYCTTFFLVQECFGIERLPSWWKARTEIYLDPKGPVWLPHHCNPMIHASEVARAEIERQKDGKANWIRKAISPAISIIPGHHFWPKKGAFHYPEILEIEELMASLDPSWFTTSHLVFSLSQVPRPAHVEHVAQI